MKQGGEDIQFSDKIEQMTLLLHRTVVVFISGKN